MPTPSSDELQWFGVKPNELEKWWSFAEPYLDSAKGDFDTLESIRSQISAGKVQLWIFWNNDRIRGAGCTEIHDYPQGKSCIARIFSADESIRDAWIGRLDVIESWARENGCKIVEIIGRPGWKRILPEYRLTHVVLRKDL